MENAEARLTEATDKQRNLLNQSIDFETLSQTKDLKTRARLRHEIRRKVARIDFWFKRDKNTPLLFCEGEEDLFPFARIGFTNGKELFIALRDGYFLVSNHRPEDFAFHPPASLRKKAKAIQEANA